MSESQGTNSDKERNLEETELEENLSLITKLGYGAGAVIYEMCSAMWFTYVVLFYTRVLGFSNSLVGVFFAFNSIADAFLVILIGYFQDYCNDWWLCRKLSKRKGWHLIGTLCLMLSDPFLFMPCIGCDNAPHGQQIFWYFSLVVMVSFGFESAQISHLALIPELTMSKIEQTSLTSYSYSAKILCYLFMYMTLWVFLGSNGGESIGPSSANIFRNVKLLCIALSGITALVLHVVVQVDNRYNKSTVASIEMGLPSKEKFGRSQNTSKNSGTLNYLFTSALSNAFMSPLYLQSSDLRKIGSQTSVELMTISHWLLQTQFWKVTALYISARLFSNLSQAYIALYLEVSLQLRPDSVAIVPLVMFLSGFCTSTSLKTLIRIFGQRGVLVITCLIGLTGSVWVGIGNLNSNGFRDKWIYVVAALFGSAGSGMVITGIAAIAKLIGQNVQSAALVYGLIYMIDKISTAITFGIIQEIVPDDNDAERRYYKSILSVVCGASTIVTILTAITTPKSKIGEIVDVNVLMFSGSRLAMFSGSRLSIVTTSASGL